MSGGSFNYLCLQELDKLVHCEEDVENMADALEEMGYPNIAIDTREVYKNLNTALEVHENNVKSLQKIWKAVEWKVSGDWGEERIKEAVAEYTPPRWLLEGNLCPECELNINNCHCELERLGIKEEDRKEFIVKQSYDKEETRTLVCKCGNDKFKVGTGSHFTAIKCEVCSLEICIHSG